MNGNQRLHRPTAPRKPFVFAVYIFCAAMTYLLVSNASEGSSIKTTKLQYSSRIYGLTSDVGTIDVLGVTQNHTRYLPIIMSQFWSIRGDIAYVTNRDGNNEIYLVNEDGTDLQNLSQNPANDQDPAWSPDGRKLAFASDRSGFSALYVLDLNGGVLRQVTNVSTGSRGPVWSPDGSKIAFYSQKGFVEELSIYWINADGSGLKRVATLPGYGGTITWSTDGQQLLFDANPEDFDLYIVNLDGTGLQIIASTSSWEFAPTWSPNGRYLAFSSDRYFGLLDVYVSNANGSDIKNLTQSTSYSYGPEWSPDSQWIAFMSTEGLHITRPDWTQPRKLTSLSQQGAYSQWSWAPESDRLAFTAGEGVNKEVYIIDTNGIGLMNLSKKSGWDWDPEWRP